ncbi:MAG: sigma-70 family RNA polymerase sigma factor [Acutalibacteraceae bacterium]
MKDYSSMSDEALVSLCRNNDEAAWDELYARYHAVSKVLSSKFYVGGIERDDLVQEGLLGFLSAVHSYKSEKNASFSTFARTCMKNRIINAVSSNQKKSLVPAKLCLSLNGEEDIVDSSLSPEELMIFRNDAGQAKKIVSTKLSEKERAVFKAYLCGKTYDETAQLLSMSRKAVDGALQRAKRKIRREFEE